jgi:indole-3-glycerol phosphate synthase/phosphoribosylanthranilate isomerase
MVFAPESPRSVSLANALRLNSLHGATVGVFRNAPIEQIDHFAAVLGLAAVQLHGDEDASYARKLARRLPADCEVWKAVTVGRGVPGSFAAADRLVFDTGSGGSGRSFDWSSIKGHPDFARAIVAGGIGSHNALAALRLGSHAIDVGSSTDRKPGEKSPEKIAVLFEALRPPGRERMRACA